MWPGQKGTPRTLNVVPGDSAGHRTMYIEVWDPSGLTASAFIAVDLGSSPVVASPLPDQAVKQGEDLELNLNDYFTAPAGESLDFAAQAPSRIALFFLTGGRLTMHGQTALVEDVTITATTSIGLSVSETFTLTVHPSVGSAPNPIHRDLRQLFARYGEEVGLTFRSTS